MSTSRLVELAEQIRTSTVKFDDYLKTNNLPSPSFETGVQQDYLDALPEAARATKQVVIEALDELHKLLIGPMGILMHDALHHMDFSSVQIVNRFGMAKAVPKGNQGATYDEISNKCGLSEPTTRRVLRYAITRHVFQEKQGGFVTHTAASEMIAENPLLQDWIGAIADDFIPPNSRLADALEKYKDSEEPTETAHNLAHNTEMTQWERLASMPWRAKRFGNCMTLFSMGDPFSSRHVVDNVSWASLGEGATVVDLGGSHGGFMLAVAEKFPNVKCIVQDRKEVVEEARAMNPVPPHLKGRVDFMEHDFLTEQPIKGADVYFFRWILHDWSDKYVRKILSSLVPAFKPGSKLVIFDVLLPAPGQVPPMAERDMRALDFVMMGSFNAREREEKDWKVIFQATDPRLKFVQAKQPPGSALGVVEAVWEP